MKHLRKYNEDVNQEFEFDEEYIKGLDLNSAVLIVHNLGNIINVPRLKSQRPVSEKAPTN